WIAGERISWSRSKDADHEAIEEGFVSITPIRLDTTHYGVLDQFRAWESIMNRGVKKSSTPRSTISRTRQLGS
ncbi:MAG TPA: 5'/3'-nucleotidase SurE, partial [Nitrospira sp.]|nr:5'/3'-nucleotidase SurE [Nitrospira sp.]